MECKYFRRDIPDLLDGRLSPALETALRAHAEGCPSCGAELGAIERALAELRGAPREEPPPDLAGAILARVRAIPVLPPGVPRESYRRLRLAFRWAAAAAILLAALAGLLLSGWREEGRRRADAEMIAGDLAATRARLELDLEAARGSSRSDREDLLGEIAAVRSLLAAEREAAGKARATTAREAADLRSRTAEAAARASEAEEEARKLRESLARAQRESASAAEELAAAKTALEEKERALAAAAKAAPRNPRPAEAAPPPAGPAIAFRKSPAGLELEMRGPRREIIPELFRIAWSDEPDRAGLARCALEDLLGGGGSQPPDPAPGRTGILGWWDRGIGTLAADTGLAGGTPEGEDASSAVARRLRELEEIWDRESSPGTTPSRSER